MEGLALVRRHGEDVGVGDEQPRLGLSLMVGRCAQLRRSQTERAEEKQQRTQRAAGTEKEQRAGHTFSYAFRFVETTKKRHISLG